MKIPYRLALLGVIAGIVLSSLMFAQAQADNTTPLTPDQQQHIKDNCSLIKSTLNQLQVTDALLRVNRGQFYESMSSKLMAPFNTRLSNNSIDNTNFVAITNSYNNTLNSFRTDYQAYEQQLSNTLAVDCTTQPVNFNTALLSSRALRNKVHDDVTNLNQGIANYQNLFTTFASKYQQVGSGESQ